MVRPLVVVCLGVSYVLPAFAQSAERKTAALDAADCNGVPYDRASLIELLRVELGALGVERVVATSAEASALRLSIAPTTCDPSTSELVLRVTEPGSPVFKERKMPLADVPLPNRSRALAIALAELAREAPVVENTPAPTPAPVAEKPAETPRPPSPPLAALLSDMPPRPEPRPWFGAGSVMRTFPSDSIAAFGIEALVALPVADEVRVSLGADAATGRAGPSSDSAAVGAVTAFVGVGWMLGDTTTLELGPRMHVGYGWAKDVFTLTDDPTSDHVVLLGTLAGTVHLGLPRDLHGHVGIEMGVGLLDAALFDPSLVDDRGGADEVGPVIELGARLGVDWEL